MFLTEFEDDNLLGQALSFYIAGLEAVSSAIAFSLYELSRHTEYQSQLYEEIKIHLNNEELTLESINKMEFLDRSECPKEVSSVLHYTPYILGNWSLIFLIIVF